MEPVILRGQFPDEYGAGDGYGAGYGDGTGYGYGYGAGAGYGAGYGDGYGEGDVDGAGYGAGDGYGAGVVDGYGYGDADGAYWQSCIKYFAEKWSGEQQARLKRLQAEGATIAYWRSDAKGRACNGGTNKPVAPGTIETISGTLVICTSHALHATILPLKWKGERWWIVALIGEVQWKDDKCAALQREIIGECLS